MVLTSAYKEAVVLTANCNCLERTRLGCFSLSLSRPLGALPLGEGASQQCPLEHIPDGWTVM